ncbi:MAG: DUF4142 domain-containing protein [Myxococcales bacterium]
MPSTVLVRGLPRSAICAAAALAVIAGCKTSTASGGAASGSTADGGMSTAGGTMMGGDGRRMDPDGDAGGSVARDIGQGAGTAAGNVASGVESAGRGIADAGAAAYGAVAGAASGAATTAAEAAREAAAGARSGASAAMDAGAPAARLSDAQIAAVAVAANKVDIEAARAAKKTTRNAQVKKFANDMIRDHTSANKQAAALVKKLGVTPEENDISRAITQGGKDNLANLKSMKGKKFDRAYAEHEVAYHQEVLGALDEKLIPGAQNAELKSLLQSVRAVVAQHLDHAAALVDSLSK